MAEWKSRVGKLALVLAVTLVAGCPQNFTPQLNATPGAVDFGSEQTTRNISLANIGGGSLTWTAQEVTRVDVDSDWTPGDVPWLTLSTVEGTITTALENLTLTASRSGLTAGLYTNTGVQISSNGGTVTIPVSLVVEASLQVVPQTISLSAADTTSGFTLRNNGATPISWSASYLPDAGDPDSASPFPSGFTLNPGTGTLQSQSSQSITLTFPSGQPDFGVRITSSSGSATVVFTVGSALNGFNISPSTLRVSLAEGGAANAEQPPSTLTLENVGATPISWTISLRDTLSPTTVPPLAANPILGTTAVGATSEIAVRVTNPNEVVQGDGRYELVVRSGEAFQVVPIVIDVLPLPDIVISHAPDTQVLQPPVVQKTLLDFGMETIQQQFWVVNVGSADSQLFFDITHDDQDASRPLIASVTPARGNTNGPDQDYFLGDQQLYTDGAPVTVTINRANLVEDVETRTITVRAFDSDFVTRLPTVEVETIQVRVEKQPFIITGALNRSRPPNLLRYVLSNRDDLGQIVPLQTAADRARIGYDIFEDDVPLDLNETSQFLTYGYRGNVVLMLDFTGSLYNAGTAGANPLRPGDAVALMREAAKTFIDDLPANFRLQLMYFSDRIAENRVIQPFTTDRALLKDKLDKFTLSPALYGNSDIFDALGQAMEALALEDPATTLPFDDADLRVIVFITDGLDTVSGLTLSDVEGRAEDTKTRLYPVTYSPNGSAVNLADMLTAANSSGGYLYNAGTVRELDKVLGTESNMRLVPRVGSVGNTASFTIQNLSAQAIFFEVSEAGNSPWLGAFNETSGVIEGNGTRQIAVTLNPTGVAAGTVLEGTVNVAAGDGTGQVLVQFRTAAGNTVAAVSTSVRDEPGTLWEEFNNQSVVTYMTPKEESFGYILSGRYTKPDGRVIEGAFERDGNFLIGDPIVGQVSLKSAGIVEDRTTIDPNERFRADAFVYADYIPRNITAFSFRFHLLAPDDVSPASQALLGSIAMDVEIADGGILADDNVGTADWRLISDGEGRYRLITDEANFLPVASFGNMLKITFTNLDEYVASFGAGARQPEFLLAMRMDNQIYFSPQSERQPSTTKYFLYPGGLANEDRVLSLETNRSDIAGPAPDPQLLAGLEGFDPEDPVAFDSDEDSYPNFNDPFPFDDQFPGAFIVPNPFEVDGASTEFTLTVRNATLDRFDWSVDAATLPPWLPEAAIRYGATRGTVPRSTLLPGESETVHFTVDRTGQTPGTSETAIVEFSISNSEYTFFVPERVPVTLVTNP